MNKAQFVFKAVDIIGNPSQNNIRYENVVSVRDIAYGSEKLNRGDLYYIPEILNDGKKHPVIVYYHGGAFLAGDKEGGKFHLNQALTLGILSLGLMLCGKILGIIPLIGWILALIINIVNLLVFVCIILGIVYAAQGQDKEVPLLGSIKI